MKMDWIDTLRAYGARKEDIILLDGNHKPSILPYLDLVERRFRRSAPMPDAIIQVQRQPLLYLYSEAQFASAQQTHERLPQIKKLIAMRGDASLLGILRHGVLELHSTALGPTSKNQTYTIKADDSNAGWLIPRLAQGNSPVPFAEKFIETELFRLLEQSSKDLHDTGLSVAEIVSLTGRAVFLRFLLDRDILPRNHVAPFLLQENQSPNEAFANPSNSAATCRWLDKTFNGDLFPLPNNGPETYFNSLGRNGDRVFNALQAILHFDDPLGTGAYQRRIDWGDLHLAYVPVGLLSQVYERHMELFYPEMRKTTSAYYTPRHLAEIMVDEAFYGIDQPHLVKVLDPAAGAGVFLVATYHKLVEARWQQDGKRPNRKVLSSILNQQIRGFDVNCHALKLAALSLYLTRLELDPDPSPIDALRFDSLQGKVLFDWSGQAETENEPPLHPVAGSLGDQVGAEHEGAYDIVIGNPPWSSNGKDNTNLQKLYTDVSRGIAETRGIPDAINYSNPDGVPDLPFLWKSMQWARPGGRIALALHARWLFKQSLKGIRSRNTILRTLRITGLLNGAALRKTEVWPRVTAPFCLVFAENSLPNADGFFFVSPQVDPTLNKEGRLRIDAQSAEPVLNQDVIDKPWILKSVFRGNRLSCDVIYKVFQQKLPTIGQYWGENRLAFGKGYQTTESGKQDADFLCGRLDVTANYAAHPFKVKPETLNKFDRALVHRRKPQEIYRQPLVLIRQGFRYDRNRGRALLVSNIEEISFSRSYIGLSCFGHNNAELLSQYIFLLFHSKFLLFFLLSTSSQFGVERDAPLTEDINQLPLIPLEQLKQEQQNRIGHLVNQMISNPSFPPWFEIDELIEEIYGLNRWDRQVIEDTLATCLPDGASEAKQAAMPSSSTQKEKFKNALFVSLEPFFSVTGRKLHVTLCDSDNTNPWAFIDIDATGQVQQTLEELPINILEKADDLMVSRIIHTWENHPGRLRVGILDQLRYWTHTQARLLASDVLRNYGHQLEQGS